MLSLQNRDVLASENFYGKTVAAEVAKFATVCVRTHASSYGSQ